MRKLLILSVMAIISVAITQNNLVPEITLNSFVLPQGGELKLTASKLANGLYKLAITNPTGEVFYEDINTNNGHIDYAMNLDKDGNWSLNLYGNGLDTTLPVSVMPSPAITDVEAESDSTTAEASPENDTSLNTQVDTSSTQLDNTTVVDGLDTTTTAQIDTSITQPDDAPVIDNVDTVTEQVDTDAPAVGNVDTITEQADTPTTQVDDSPVTEQAEASTTQADNTENDNKTEDSTNIENTSIDSTDTSTTPITSEAEVLEPNIDTSISTSESNLDTEVSDTTDTNTTDRSLSDMNTLDRIFSALAEKAWYVALAVLFAGLALHLVLLFKYWKPQSVMLNRKLQNGGKPSPIARLFAIRYYSFTEKLVQGLILATVWLLVGLAAWNDKVNSLTLDPSGLTNSGWQDAIAKTFSSLYLLDANPFSLHSIFWKILLGLFLVYAVISILWMLWPRPRMARNAPRSILYHLFSFLVPGSGLADEMWGILLLLPWAVFGLDAIARLFGLSMTINGLNLRLDYIVLAAIYIINLIAIVVEFFSYRQRINKLKEDNPELAQEFNLI